MQPRPLRVEKPRVPVLVLTGLALSMLCTSTLAASPRKPASSPAQTGRGRDAVAPAPDRVIHETAFVALAPERAFAMFTEPELLRRWLCADAVVEPRVGGKYELFWRPDDRENDSTIGCRITVHEPARLLAFQWRSPRQFKAFANTADPLTHAVLMFVPEASGTRVHLVHSGWRSDPDWEAARAWQERAWSMAFGELERVTRP